jgi:hypothetical protein
MKPLVFNDTIGWLKEADGDCGVVIAGAHGFEDLCSRRFLTLLADHIAQSGSPVRNSTIPAAAMPRATMQRPAGLPPGSTV